MKNVMKELVINVDRSLPFKLPKEIIEEYGDYSISWHHKIAARVKEFTLRDLLFINGPSNFVKGTKFAEKVISDGYVPLDAFCARAIFDRKDLLRELRSNWWDTQGGLFSGKDLETINFFGSKLTDGLREHLLCFKYTRYQDVRIPPEFLPYEDDEAWSKDFDFALVFRKEFIQKKFS